MKLRLLILLTCVCSLCHPIYTQVKQSSVYTHQESIEHLDSLGLHHYDLREYKTADSLFRLSLRLKQESLPIDDLAFAFSYHKIGNVNASLRSYKPALENYLKALEIRQVHLDENEDDVLNLYLNIAQVYRNVKDYENAVLFFLKNIDTRVIHNGEEDPELGSLYFFLGLSYNMINDYDKAIAALHMSIENGLKNLGAGHIDLSNSYQQLGRAYQMTNQYNLSLKANLKAHEIRVNELKPGDRRLVNTCMALGMTYKNKGEYELASRYLNEALNINSKHYEIDSPRLVSTFTNLGLTYMYMGEFELASQYLNNSLKINKKHLGENHIRVATAYNNLAALHSRTGDFEKCDAYISNAEKIYTAESDTPNPDFARILLNVGATNYILGNLDKALEYYDKSLNIFKLIHIDRHATIAGCYHRMGIVYLDLKDYIKAYDYTEKALQMRLEIYGENSLEVAGSMENLGLINSEYEKYDTAIGLIEEAVKINREFLDEHHPSFLRSLVSLASQYEKMGQVAVADSIWGNTIQNLYESLEYRYINMSNTQRIDYLNTIKEINDDFYSFTTKHGSDQLKELAANYLLNTKSIALDYAISTEKLIKKINDPALSNQNNILHELTDSISILRQMNLNDNTKDLFVLEEERDSITNHILDHPELKSRLNIRKVHWSTIQAKLAPNEATIDFLRAQNKEDSLWIYYAIIILKDQDFPQFIRTTDEENLHQLLEVDEGENPEFLQSRRNRKSLYNKFWKPISSHLEGIKTLHISPTQSLYRLPIESLQDEQNNYLVDQYTFHYYTSLRDFQYKKSQRMTYRDVLLLGNIIYSTDEDSIYKDNKKYQVNSQTLNHDYRSGINPLPGTRKEIEDIEKISKQAGLTSYMLTSRDASEAAINDYTKEKATSILHFATHGVSLNTELASKPGQVDALFISSDNPLQKSALLLSGAEGTWMKEKKIRNDSSDGVLTALEVTNMDLQNTQLVVLSACKTGLGAVYTSEGVFGLQRAFKIAGVNAIVASLWDVSDKATNELMVSFYHHLLINNEAPASALRSAKRKLMTAGYEPSAWAAFLLIE